MQVKMNHVGLWIKDIEAMKVFYCRYFEATSSELYHNQKNRFCFLFSHFYSWCQIRIDA